MVAPSVLFGLLHYRPETGANGTLIMLWATAFCPDRRRSYSACGTLGRRDCAAFSYQIAKCAVDLVGG